MYVLYKYDLILYGPHKDEVKKSIQDIKNAKLNITIKGYLQYFLGKNIDISQDWSTHLMQPHMIDQILQYIKMWETAKPESICRIKFPIVITTQLFDILWKII